MAGGSGGCEAAAGAAVAVGLVDDLNDDLQSVGFDGAQLEASVRRERVPHASWVRLEDSCYVGVDPRLPRLPRDDCSSS